MAADRRERRQFEPPPWERSGQGAPEPDHGGRPGDEMRRAPDGVGSMEGTGQAATPAMNGGEPSTQAVPGGAGRNTTPAEADRTEPGRDAAKRGGTEIDQAKVDAMLVQLRFEEPAESKRGAGVAIISAAVMIATGGVMLIWGLAAMKRSAEAGGVAAGYVGASIVLGFGFVIVGLGLWLLVRSLRQRGDI